MTPAAGVAPPGSAGKMPALHVNRGNCLAAAPGLFLCDPFAARGGEPAWRVEWAPRDPR